MPQTQDPIKVGVITDQTGALSFMGVANANVAADVTSGSRIVDDPVLLTGVPDTTVAATPLRAL